MSKKAILTVLCGLPGSGKSYYADNLSRATDAIVVSSDELRRELLGNVNDQSQNNRVFQEAFTRIDNNLREGNNVVFDATNVNEKKRRAIVGTFRPNCSEINLVYMNTGYDDCIFRDAKRDRNVGEQVIHRMRKKLNFPTIYEGWSNVELINDKPIHERASYLDLKFEQMLFSHDALCRLLSAMEMLTGERSSRMINFPQDTTHHTFSVSMHTWHVYKYLYDNYNLDKDLLDFDKRRKNMLWAAILHDVGKPVCKEFVDNSRYASFIGHAEVSAQMACAALSQVAEDKEDIKDICNIISYHMLLLNGMAPNKLANKYSPSFLEDLIIFAEADQRAK